MLSFHPNIKKLHLALAPRNQITYYIILSQATTLALDLAGAWAYIKKENLPK
jgi:hypothetical protein